MNALLRTVAISSALVVPAIVLAQPSNQPVSRDQVRTELRQLEEAGYRPGVADDAQYPNDLQAAKARAASKNGMGENATGVGGTRGGASQSGRPMPSVSEPESAPQ